MQREAFLSVIDMATIEKLQKLEKPGKPSFLAKLIDLFFTSGQQSMEQIRAAAKNKDLPALAAAAHSLKSGSGNLGAIAFSEICFELENFGNGFTPEAELSEIISRLESAYIKVIADLQKLKSNLP